MKLPVPKRRHALALAAASAAWVACAPRALRAEAKHPDQRWYAKAREMKELAESWGDQSYGAVVVLGSKIIGLGPSRVVKDRDADAHAERVAIREAQRELGSRALSGSVLYSTSRPCALCEEAAARAGVSRMYYGPSLADAGPPKLRNE